VAACRADSLNSLPHTAQKPSARSIFFGSSQSGKTSTSTSPSSATRASWTDTPPCPLFVWFPRGFGMAPARCFSAGRPSSHFGTSSWHALHVARSFLGVGPRGARFRVAAVCHVFGDAGIRDRTGWFCTKTLGNRRPQRMRRRGGEPPYISVIHRQFEQFESVWARGISAASLNSLAAWGPSPPVCASLECPRSLASPLRRFKPRQFKLRLLPPPLRQLVFRTLARTL